MRHVPAILLVALLSLTGCAYKLGPTNGIHSGARSVSFKPFNNETKEPRVVEYIGNSLRKTLQQDGTYHLDTSGTPDILVSGTVTKFLRNGLSYDPNDVLTPQEYTLTIQAHMVAVDTSTGKKIIDRTIIGHTYIRVGFDEYSNERQAIPLLADALAHDAVGLLADGQW